MGKMKEFLIMEEYRLPQPEDFDIPVEPKEAPEKGVTDTSSDTP
jgi:hypothetical protein